MSVNVQLSKFEGPLALLLYLIRKDEMDIFDIKINEITTQYLDYIKLMKELDLEVAGEFVAMAATLIQIKSKMLLPQYDEKGEIIESEDPRKELVQKLLEYQKYQEAARLLYERPLVGRDMWTRGVRLNLDEPTEEIEVEENGLFQMISLYRQIMRSAKKRIHQVTAKAQSIASRILEIKDLLVMGTRKTLNEIVGAGENQVRQVLITFLSVLELAKLGFVGLYQTETYGDIWIDLKKPIEKDVVSSVEEYGAINNKADDLFAQAEKEEADAEAVQGNLEDFVLVDAEDRIEAEEGAEISADDMATDEEILMAEMELNGEVVVRDNVVAIELEQEPIVSEAAADSQEHVVDAAPVAEDQALFQEEKAPILDESEESLEDNLNLAATSEADEPALVANEVELAEDAENLDEVAIEEINAIDNEIAIIDEDFEIVDDVDETIELSFVENNEEILGEEPSEPASNEEIVAANATEDQAEEQDISDDGESPRDPEVQV
jgi:segregation and condensation protein A